MAGSPAAAQPTGGQVVAGAATFAAGAGTLTVTQASARAIINWQDFSLAAGELARFVQPDATSATLNRVVSGLPSSLAGTLQANGRVFLINPNGILIGAHARIDTAGFLASTLDVTNREFLAGGDLHFTGGSTAAVRSLGTINALGGDVFLIARRVENAGTINAANGATGLAAGSEILLTTGGNERLFVLAASVPGVAVNSGTITAASAELRAAGGNAYALAINNSGIVRATGSAVRHGQVWLVASGDSTVINSGALEASSPAGQGGQVSVMGGRVLIDHGSRVGASGATGGGEILVFGGMPAGGQVIVHGTLDASATGGDGGFIETSAASVKVSDDARVTTAAPDGRSGTWLIDPADFTIAATGGDMTGAAVGTALAGGNFTIQSTTGGAGTAGDVNVNDPVSWSANKLTLNAQNNINFNASMNGSGSASLALEYGQGAVAAGNSSDYLVRAAVNLPAGNNFSTKLGSDGAVQNFTVITSLGAQGSTTATDLQGVSGGLTGRYVLGADIDATATSGWNASAGFAPIGTAATRFTGAFDGLGHSVSGLTIARPAQNDVGLFGYLGVGGVLKNISVAGGSITGMTGVGALLGSNSGTVSKASASAVVSGRSNVGGLVGSSFGTVSSAWATGTVSNASGTLGFVGGLVGNNVGTVSNSWASGNVSGTGPNVGGLVGFHQGAGGTINNTYATGIVSGTLFVGGLTGSNAAPVTNSYATGSVTGTGNYVGGLVGYNYPGITISNTYATGSVSSPGLAGGLAGNNAGTINTSYWNSTVNATGIGGGTTAGATGRTAAEMMQLASFTGFNIASTGGSGAVWRIYEGNTTPWLRVFLTPLTVTANNDTKTYNGTAYSGGNSVTYSVASPSPAPSGSLAFGGTAQSALNAGTYAITTSGLYSVQQGHDISYAAGTLTINQANLALAGTRTYDGATTFAGSNLTATGVNGETFTLTGAGATGNLTTKNVQTGQRLASVTGLALGAGNTGAAIASNYNAISTTGSAVSVTPASLTVSTSNVVKTYDGSTTAAGTPIITAGVLLGGDALAFGGLGPSYAFVGKDVGLGNKTVTVSGIGVSDGNSGNNYTVVLADNTTSTINPASLSLAGTRTYDGATTFAGSNLTATGVNGETFTLTGAGATGNLTTKNVQTGQRLASVTGLVLGAGNTGAAIASNYNAISTTGSAVSVTPASLTVSTSNVVKTYDGSTTAAGTPIITAGVLLGGDALAFGGLGPSYAFVGKDVGLGNKTVTVSGIGVSDGNSGNNYTVVLADNTTSTINPASLSLAGTRTYDGATTFAGSNLTATGVNGETFTLTGAGATGNLTTKNVQTGQRLASVTGLVLGAGNTGAAIASNYNAISTTGSAVSVTPKALTIAGFVSNDKIYDGTTAAVIATPGTLSGVVPGDTVGFTSTGATFDTKNVGTGRTVTLNGVTLTGSGDQRNYGYTATTTDLSDITAATLTYTANAANRLYGSANPGFSGTVTGFVGGEVQGTATTGTMIFASAATAANNIGGYAILGSGLSANNANYVFVQAPGNAAALTISPAPLTVAADNKSRAPGVANPAFTATYAGFVNGETPAIVTGLTLATTAVLGSPTGSYPITAAGATAPNYTLTFVSGLLAVGQNLLTITADNKTKTYGAALPAFTATFAGFINGDTAASVTGLQFSTTATMSSNAGTFTITPFGATAPASYIVGYVPGTLTINPASLLLTANNASRFYGAANPAFTATYAGFVNNDTAAAVSGLLFSTPATATSAVGDYAITPLGATAANYTLAFVNGTLSVLTPTVFVGTAPVPVVTIGQVPVNTPELAVILLGDRPVLVSVGSPGGFSAPLDGRLALTLGAATNPPGFKGATAFAGSPAARQPASANALNFGRFEPVASPAGGGSGAASPAQQNEPGVFRESTVSLGGFNVIYHESLADARQQEESNTALGSSYREFADSDNPQVNLVRAKAERKPAAGRDSPGAP